MMVLRHVRVNEQKTFVCLKEHLNPHLLFPSLEKLPFFYFLSQTSQGRVQVARSKYAYTCRHRRSTKLTFSFVKFYCGALL